MSRPDPEHSARDLRRLGESGDLFSSSAAGPGAPAPEEEDWAERVGRRIGRSLAVIAALGLLAYYVLFPN